MHELLPDEKLDIKYKEIKEKYERRCNRFLAAIKEPTCFFRMVKDNDEITYINENMQYIESIIKKSNVNNEIVFLLLQGFDAPKCGRYFYLAREKFLWNKQLFDYPSELHDFVLNMMPLRSKVANLRFIMEKHPIKILSIAHTRPAINNLLSIFFSNKDWYIWGAGCYGNNLKEFLMDKE